MGLKKHALGVLVLCAVFGGAAADSEFLSKIFGRSAGNDSESSSSFFNVSNPFSGVLTKSEKKLKDVIDGLGDVKAIYEAQFALLKKEKTYKKRLLVRVRDDTVVTDEDSGEEEEESFFSGLSDLVDKAVNITGSERAARHVARIKDLVDKAKGGVKRMQGVLKKHKLKGLKTMFHGVQSGVDILEIEDGFGFEDTWRKMLELDDIEFVEPDLLMELSASESDCPLVSDWGFRKSRAADGIALLSAGGSGSSQDSEVIVAVVDSGVDFTHPLLKDRIWVNQAELNGEPGVDDDGNGLVDDISGWNFAENNNDVMDFNAHGTHVAGVIAAAPSTSPRIQGLAPNAKILPCKFTSAATGGTISSAIQCLEYAWMMGADITSNSWGGAGAFSLSLSSAIDRAERSGVMVVAAAGNDGVDNDPSVVQATFPASFDHDIILSVAAVDADGRLSPVSNFGGESVDIGAPGVQILSTAPDNKYLSMTGTSMATPFMSGAAALLMGICRVQDRECSAIEVKEALLSSAQETEYLAGLVRTNGHLDVMKAANELGLTSAAPALQSEDVDMDDLRECTGGAERITGSAFIIAFITTFVLWIEL